MDPVVLDGMGEWVLGTIIGDSLGTTSPIPY